MEPDPIVGVLRARRKQLGISRAEMARLLGRSVMSLEQWEGGHANPSLRVAHEWARLLGMVLVVVEAGDVMADVTA